MSYITYYCSSIFNPRMAGMFLYASDNDSEATSIGSLPWQFSGI